MSTRPPSPPLPDLEDDEAFRLRMHPLIERTVPGSRKSGLPVVRETKSKDNWSNVGPEVRISGISEDRIDRPTIHPTTGQPDNREQRLVEARSSGILAAAQRQADVEAARGAKRRFEYLIPDRVGKALADDAARRGVSATTRLLEVLRDSGYPVIPEDLVDLRRMPKR